MFDGKLSMLEGSHIQDVIDPAGAACPGQTLERKSLCKNDGLHFMPCCQMLTYRC